MRFESTAPITLRNKTIGGRLPLVCLPLVAHDKAGLLEQARDLSALDPDLLEWRIDAYQDVENVDLCLKALLALRQAIESIPLIFTCRISREGGMQPVSQQDRFKLIMAAINSGCIDIVDIELCNEAEFIRDILDSAQHNQVKTILSFHDFEKTPEPDMIVQRLKEALDLGADICKVAVMPQTYEDVLVLFQATLAARSKMPHAAIATMAMGERGLVTRLAGGVFGSDITFAAGKNTSAPGQPPITDLRRVITALY